MLTAVAIYPAGSLGKEGIRSEHKLMHFKYQPSSDQIVDFLDDIFGMFQDDGLNDDFDERSMMPGDLIRINGVTFMVQPVGFSTVQ